MPLAQQVANATDRGDARYYVGPGSGLTEYAPGLFTDGTYHYDSNGLSLDRPNAFVQGIGTASDSASFDPWTGQSQPSGPGGGGGGGLASLGIDSPFFQQAKSATQAAEAADAAARKQAIQQMLAQFGLVPQGFTDPYGDVDQTTRDLAAANTTSGISIAARLKQALQDAQRNSSRQLTARGLRRSGARGYQMRRNQLGYDQNYSDAVAKLLGAAQGVYSGFAQNEYGRQMSLAGALQSALNSMGGYYRGGGYSPPSAPQPAAPPSTPNYATYGGGQTQGGYGTAYGPSAPGQGGGFTSPKKPLLFA